MLPATTNTVKRNFNSPNYSTAVVGLEMLGVLAQVTSRGAAFAQATVGRLLSGVIRSPPLAAPLALGVFNAFLPCQLIYAFAARGQHGVGH